MYINVGDKKTMILSIVQLILERNLCFTIPIHEHLYRSNNLFMISFQILIVSCALESTCTSTNENQNDMKV